MPLNQAYKKVKLLGWYLMVFAPWSRFCQSYLQNNRNFISHFYRKLILVIFYFLIFFFFVATFFSFCVCAQRKKLCICNSILFAFACNIKHFAIACALFFSLSSPVFQQLTGKSFLPMFHVSPKDFKLDKDNYRQICVLPWY